MITLKITENEISSISMWNYNFRKIDKETAYKITDEHYRNYID